MSGVVTRRRAYRRRHQRLDSKPRRYDRPTGSGRHVDTIVVGIDDSDTARQAADVAASLAAGLDAPLHLVTAYEHRAPKRVDAGPLEFAGLGSLDEAELQLAKVAAEIRARVPSLTTAAVAAKPAQALVAEAERLGAALIVIGNRHTHGVARVLGAVATKVLSSAPCDVYVVKTT
jgi:nucleotide-binding universal stress UspA family protein